MPLCATFLLTVYVQWLYIGLAMKNPSTRRRAQAPKLKGDRLVGRCDRALKNEVARALELTGLDESKLVRLAVQQVVPALLERRMVLINGELVPAISAPASFVATGTEGGR